MRSPTLDELPAPPLDKEGWPWTTSGETLEESIETDRDFPRMSIVTVSFNQGEYLEETIRSVLLQGYPDLEYIIIDGGSTDRSVEIIEKYSPWLSYWVSEKDSGQSNAINKGLKRVTGDIIAWINSDDYYFPGVLNRVAQEINPEKNRFVVVGKAYLYNQNQKEEGIFHGLSPVFSPYNLLFHHHSGKMKLPVVIPPQPAIFWHKEVLEKVKFLDEDLDKTMDHEYWLRMTLLNNYKFRSVKSNFAYYRIHSTSKSGQGWHTFAKEQKAIFERYWDNFNFGQKIFAGGYWLISSYLFIWALKCKKFLSK